MEEKFRDFIIAKILAESGIVIAPVHTIGVISYVEKVIQKRGITASQYCSELQNNQDTLTDLINHATTNETYFFREEKQFDYLKNELFPKFKNKKLVIWSAACSTGEEPLSLLALALSFNINVEIYASDIDDNVLNFFKKGVYSKYSFRRDGEAYHPLIEKLGEFNEDKSLFTIKREYLSKIHIFKYNLTDPCRPPLDTTFDIVFMRNVFIYFDYATRKKITEGVVRDMNEGGHLFYSINEIGNINRNIVPDIMKKVNYRQIYFYVKEAIRNSIKIKNDSENNVSCNCPMQIFKKITFALDSGDVDTALSIATTFKPSYTDSVYSSFFKAYVLMKTGQTLEANKYFTTAEFMKEDFWPAYYYHGMLLEHNNDKEKAIKCFAKCKDKIKAYIDSNSNKYDFLLKDVKSIYTYCVNASKGVQ